jgi:Flp pilus assembly protein protease CpaA
MYAPFFPGPLFGWAFLAVLLAVLAVASYTDLLRLVVPKFVTLTGLALGIVFNAVRGAWLGADGLPTWCLGEGGAFVGLLDGLLFALAGFAAGFGMFFLMWVLGVCGGGDVKLFAALGAWVGPYLAVCVLAMTLVIIVMVVFVRLAGQLLTGRGIRISKMHAPARRGKPQARRRVLGFSLPLAIATALVLLWVFRVDLQVVSAPPLTAARMQSHAH